MPKARRSPGPIVMLLRGLFRRCPNCGGGRVFRLWWTMKERCPRCNMKFEREEGFFLGAYVVNFGLVLILLAAYILIGVVVTLPDPPVVALTIIGMVGSALVAVFFYPMSKTFWSAIDLIMTPLDPSECESPTTGTATDGDGAQPATAPSPSS